MDKCEISDLFILLDLDIGGQKTYQLITNLIL